LAAAVLPAAAGAQIQNPTPGPPVAVDGPSADIVGLSGMAIARDGTGGLVYERNVGGLARVFVSRLVGGVFQPPEQLDATLGGASSQPVIAAGNGGVQLVAFINSGSLYVVDRPGSAGPYRAPMLIASGASNPSMQASDFGKAYLAFAAAGHGGSDVRAAYYHNGGWALESAPLNATPGDDAGAGGGHPAVATAGDGIGTVVWGEGGHIYSRRVWGTSPSIVFERADVSSLSGWSELSVAQPQAGSGGNSSYVNVAFNEVLTDGAARQSRVLVNRLQGSQYNGVKAADGISTPGSEGANQPRIAIDEYGQGLVTSARDGSHQLFAGLLGSNGAFSGVARVDSLPNGAAPDAVPASTGLSSLVVAWQQNLGGVAGSQIRTRFYPAAAGFGPEQILSASLLGSTNAPAGLAADGDGRGDAAIAWVQGTGGSTSIEAALLYQAPEGPNAIASMKYVRAPQPQLSWSPAEPWGPVRYSVTLDGAPAGTTSATSLIVPAPLGQGPHTWQVSAVNPAGLQSTGRLAEVFVDTIAPTVSLKLAPRKRKAGALIRLHVLYTDTTPAVPPGDDSGVASIVIHWGDGFVSRLQPGTHRADHKYAAAGTFRVKVAVTDRAGNRTVLFRLLKVKP
jgi:hypothetical protein